MPPETNTATVVGEATFELPLNPENILGYETAAELAAVIAEHPEILVIDDGGRVRVVGEVRDVEAVPYDQWGRRITVRCHAQLTETPPAGFGVEVTGVAEQTSLGLSGTIVQRIGDGARLVLRSTAGMPRGAEPLRMRAVRP